MLDFGQNHHGLTDAVIYARVSSQAQVKAGQGVESQITYCKQYAGYKGYTVHRTFKDSGITGSKADRNGIKEMLAFLKNNKNKRFVCLVDDVSRLARDIRVHLDLRDAIDSCYAVLESPAMTFGVDADGRYFENMQALSAMHHREKNAEQTKKRMQARAINGYWPFPAVIGLKHERKSGHGKVMVPDEPLASIIKEGMEGFANGRFQTQSEVARFFESHVEFPKNRHGKVTVEAANRILTRVLYAGYIEMPKWNIDLRKGQHEGLVSLKTFEKIQERLNGKAKVPVRNDIDADFPLRGFVACGDCGHPLTSSWSKSKTGKKHPYYMCFKKGCASKGKSIRRADMEEQFEDILKTMAPSHKLFTLVKDMFKRAWDIQGENEAAWRHAIKQEIIAKEKKVESLLDRIVDAESSNVITAYEKRITKLEREKLVLEENLSKTAKNKKPFQEVFELTMKFLESPLTLWNGHIEHKRTVLKLTFRERLEYDRKSGFRTPIPSSVFNMLEDFCASKTQMAETEGFEPSIELLTLYSLSRGAPSATRPRLQHSDRICIHFL